MKLFRLRQPRSFEPAHRSKLALALLLAVWGACGPSTCVFVLSLGRVAYSRVLDPSVGLIHRMSIGCPRVFIECPEGSRQHRHDHGQGGRFARAPRLEAATTREDWHGQVRGNSHAVAYLPTYLPTDLSFTS